MNHAFPTVSPRPWLRRAFPCLLSAAAALLLPCPARAATNTLTTLRTLNSAVEGIAIFAPLTQGADGLYYGGARQGGSNNAGSIFRLNADGTTFSTLTSFPGPGTGTNPEGGLVQARDGFFYGTTYAGGANGYGTLFQLNPAGGFTLLTSFTNGAIGANPAGTLLLGLDGFLYGTASFGGGANFGTVFRATAPGGATTALTGFAGGNDGAYPESDLIQGADGNFYGTTIRGGTADQGTIFRVTAAGGRTLLYSFTGGNDGAEPLRGLVQGGAGDFYGIARIGGAGGAGVIYRIDASGAFSVLYSFTLDGASPYNSYGRLVFATDGNLYGASYQGGSQNAGTLFRITPAGALAVLYNFTGGGDGGYPRAGLIQGSDGRFYGTTSGLDGQFSTIFRLDEGLVPPTPAVTVVRPALAAPGDTVVLQGDHFVDASAVAFTGANGATVPARSYVVRSQTYLEAVVPDSAATGTITVTSHGKSGVSTKSLAITDTSTPPPAVLPMVTVSVKDPVASEAGKNKGKFKITRTGETAGPVVVLFKASKKSTATRGVDYDFATGGVTLPAVVNSVTIPAGAATVSLAVVVIDDTVVEPDETVVLQLKPGANYTLGSVIKGKVIIADDD